jgi:hypothetical protein
MQEKRKSLIANILTTFAIIFMSVSIIGISMYHSILNASLYKDAIYKSGIYTTVSEIIERNISTALVSWERDLINQLVPNDRIENERVNTAIIMVLNTVVEQQTPELVSNIFDKIGLPTVFQTITEKKIDNDIAWLRGEREMREIFTYIPTPEQIEKLKGSSFTQVLDNFAKAAILNTKDLPACENEEQISANLEKIKNGDTKSVTCSSDQINAMLEASFDNSKASTLVEKVGDGTQNLVEQNSKIDGLLDDIYNLSMAVAQLKQDAINARSAMHALLQTAYVLFWLAAITGIIGVVMQRKGSQARQFVITVFATGLSVTIFALLYYVALVHFVIGSIPFDNVTFSTKALTVQEGTALMEALKFIVNYIAKGIIHPTFIIGVWTAVVGGIMWLWLLVYKKRKQILDKFAHIK